MKLREVAAYSWGASRDEQVLRLVYGAFRDRGFSVAKLGEGMPHFLVGKGGQTALVAVRLSKRQPVNRKHDALLRAFRSVWEGTIYDVETERDVTEAIEQMEADARIVATWGAPCTPPAKTPAVSTRRRRSSPA